MILRKMVINIKRKDIKIAIKETENINKINDAHFFLKSKTKIQNKRNNTLIKEDIVIMSLQY